MDITLALGGGGSRGAAHIGVIRVLERAGFRIKAVAGTSIGSIVAGLYATGKSADDLEKIFAAVDQSRLYGWPLSEGPGLLGLRGIADLLSPHLAERTFDQLSMPCAVIAVDLHSNREIILQDGLVLDAILGSIAIPGIFPPREYPPYLLVDGGVLDPVPVRAARALMPKLPVVAVSLMPPLALPSTPMSLPIPGSFAETIQRLNITQAVRIFLDAIDIGQRQLTEMRFQLDRPEIIIRPDVGDIGMLDNVDIPEVARRGELAALDALSDLRRATHWSSRLIRRLRP
jgi:NTE family protein